MSERGSFRGGRGRGGRGGQGQQKSGGGGGAQQEKPKKENILDLNKYIDKEVQVKFNGGREGMFSPSFAYFGSFVVFDILLSVFVTIYKVYMLTLLTVTGILKGYDQLMNLVLDDVKETMRGEFQNF
jgi:U6 snRNA-associated Sm-like protein LSm7